MSGMRLALRQVKYENRAFWRNPAAAFFTIFFPLLFLVIFNLLFSGEIDVTGGRASASTFFVPAIAAMSVINACFTNLAITVTFQRDFGLLKRLRGSPLPGWAFFFGRVAHSTLIALLLVAIVMAAGAVFYGVDVPTGTLPAVVVSLVVGAAAFSALGLAIVGFVPNADASPAVVNAVIMPLLFISDIFIRLDRVPRWLQVTGDLFPLKHLSLAMQTAFNPFVHGAGFEPAHLAVIALWGAAGTAVALRTFSWEPRQ